MFQKVANYLATSTNFQTYLYDVTNFLIVTFLFVFAFYGIIKVYEIFFNNEMRRNGNKLKGPKAWPFIGNAAHFAGKTEG